MRILKIAVGGLAAILVTLVVLTVALEEYPPELRPPQQQAFCAAIRAARVGYYAALDARNEIRRNERTARVRKVRRQEFERLLSPDGRIEEWRVIVGRVSDEALSGVLGPQLRLFLGCKAIIVTTNDLREARSQLGRLQVEESVLLWGSFEVGDPDDFVREMSLTEFGGIDEPEFAFRLERLLEP